jgi:phosphate transport system substrate-binding protein
MTGRTWRASRPAALAVALVLLGAACSEEKIGGGSSSDLSGSITVDGSSTVAPLTSAAAELFGAQHRDVAVSVGTSGTGGGFKKFCAGEIDMADASRPIKDDDEFEGLACGENGIEYEEIQVANDGLSLAVNPENDWVECLTVEQLRSIWEPDSTVDNWNQVDPSFPDQPLALFGAGTSSGTFDYFTEAIVGEEGASRSDYTASEDDNTTVQGVAGDKGALGYFGLSYFEENQDTLKVVAVDGGNGCVTPSTETVQSGEYTPLSRPLFVYPSADLLARPEGMAFLEFFIANEAEIGERALFVPLTAEQEAEAQSAVDSLQNAGAGPAGE